MSVSCRPGAMKQQNADGSGRNWGGLGEPKGAGWKESKPPQAEQEDEQEARRHGCRREDASGGMDAARRREPHDAATAGPPAGRQASTRARAEERPGWPRRWRASFASEGRGSGPAMDGRRKLRRAWMPDTAHVTRAKRACPRAMHRGRRRSDGVPIGPTSDGCREAACGEDRARRAKRACE